MLTNPNNNSTQYNPVGRFMVAVGAVIQHSQTKKILLVKRHASLDWHHGEWEICYGRLDQFEDPEAGLRRETNEELGITDLTIHNVLTTWHIYRGEKSVQNDLIGITFHCTTTQSEIKLSPEHQEFAWVTPAHALTLVTIPGIKRDLEKFQLSCE